MAPLAARRLEEMVELGARVVSIELHARRAGLRSSRRQARSGDGPAARQRSAASSRSSPRATRSPTSSRSSRRSARGGSAPDDGGLRRPPAPLALGPSARRSPERTEAPCLDGDVLHLREGDRTRSTSAITSSRPGSRCSTVDEIDDGRRLAAADARARGARRRRARPRSSGSGRTGSSSSPPRPAAGSRRSPSAGRGRASRACRSEPTGSTTWTTLAPTLDALRGHGGSSSSTRSPGARPPRAPAWWPAVVDYTSQMQRAYFAWLGGAPGALARRHRRLRDPRRRRPDPARAARVARRRRPLRRSIRNVFFDTASYGRRALELCIETFGVEQLVFGSDAPVVDPTPTIRAVEAFGESVARLVRQDNLARIAPVNGIGTWLADVSKLIATSRAPSCSSSPRRSRAERSLWGRHVRYDVVERHYVQMYRDPNIDIWLICWAESRTRATTITIARRVRSTCARARSSRTTSSVTRTAGSASRRTGTRPAGVRLRLDLHPRRAARRGRRPRVSLHCYSPALWRMGHYEPDDNGVLRRVAMTYADELLGVA